MSESAQNTRGKLKPPTQRQLRKEQAVAILQANAPVDVPLLSVMKGDSRALQVTSERVQRLTDSVLMVSELAINRVHGVIVNTPEGAFPTGVKDWTTSAAILIDKFRILQDLVMQMDGKHGTASIADLEKRIALLLAAQAEITRRAQEREPTDVTPKG